MTASDKPRQSTKSPSTPGKTAIRLPKSIKNQGRSKTAPLPRTSSSQSAVILVGTSSICSPSTRTPSQSKSATKLPVKAALNAAAGGHQPISISSGTQGKQPAVAAGTYGTKFGMWHVEAMHAAYWQHSRFSPLYDGSVGHCMPNPLCCHVER